METLGSLLSGLHEACAALPDERRGKNVRYRMADIGMAAFSVFFIQSPSFLDQQRRLLQGHGRSNCHTLFGMTAIPTDNHIRHMLDGVAPEHFRALFDRAVEVVEAANGLAAFRRLDGRVLVALDGTEHFCSRKLHCPQCSHRRRADGEVEYFHRFLGAALVAPGHTNVLSLLPEFIVPQDGADKQDSEHAAAKRWLIANGPTVSSLRPIYLGDDLFSCQPIGAAVQAAGGNFIFVCKPQSHQTVSEYLNGVELDRHEQIVRIRHRRQHHIYRWMNQVPLRDSKDALLVNWLEIEIRDAAGKRTYYNSFVTDLPVDRDNVAEIAACGRARWKIENETFNVLKTNGYNLDHNFGHGKRSLANLLVVLNLLAFTLHTVAYLCEAAWRAAVTAVGARRRFFEHLRTITVYVVFPNWAELIATVIDPKARPP